MDKMEEKDFKILYDLMKENDTRLKRVETALLGDESYNSDGLVHKVTNNSKQIEENSAKLNKIWISATAIGALVAGIIQILALFL